MNEQETILNETIPLPTVFTFNEEMNKYVESNLTMQDIDIVFALADKEIN